MAVNATTYLNEIISGHPILGVFNYFNSSFGGWFLFLLYITFRITLQIKTKNSLTGWITTTIFLSLYIANYYNTEYFSHSGLSIIFLVLVFELAATLYNSFIK